MASDAQFRAQRPQPTHLSGLMRAPSRVMLIAPRLHSLMHMPHSVQPFETT